MNKLINYSESAEPPGQKKKDERSRCSVVQNLSVVEPVLDVEDAGVVQDVEGGVVRRHSLVKGGCRGESVVTGRRAEGVSSPKPMFS